MTLTKSLIKNISSNYIRAKQEECGGNAKAEMRYLLFAMQDIITLLESYNNDTGLQDPTIDDITARTYAESMHHSAERIRELTAAEAER